MKLRACFVIVSFLSVMVCTIFAQTSATKPTPASTQVPRLIRFSGVAKDESGQPITGVLGITFSLYKEQQMGSSMWMETQNVHADATGHYTALLGSASADGVPLELFSSGEAQWLGVHIQGQPEGPRVLLVSVPYALKAHDAETLSGRSVSDFMLTNNTKSQSTSSENTHPSFIGVRSSSPPAPAGPTTFTGSNTTQIVGVTQSGSGTGVSATATTHAAVAGTITGASNTAVYGLASNTSAGSNAAGVTGQANTQLGPGVQGVTTSAKGIGVQGVATSSSSGTAVQGLNKATSGVSTGVSGQTSSVTTNSSGVNGFEAATTGQVFGVNGSTNSITSGAAGVNGFEGAASGQVYGVSGVTKSATNDAAGVSGFATATSGGISGVYGQSASATGKGVTGNATATSGSTAGVYGQSASPNGNGVSGTNIATTGSTNGVYGQANSTSGIGVQGSATATSGATVGVQAAVNSSSGVAGLFSNVSGAGLILKGLSGSSYKQVFSVDASGNGFYAGNLNVTGKVTKGSGSFKIDHPIDPAKKYLSHSFVESPDMMNVYNGNITTDRHGLATVTLPDYFEALNQDFRYQLTVIGQFAQAIVANKIAANRFVIRTSKPNVEVSWQVTGIRQDAYANSYRIQVEEEKPPQEQGHYLHPELFGAPPEQAVGYHAPTVPMQTESAHVSSLTAPPAPLQ